MKSNLPTISVRWIPLLMLEGPDLEPGISTSSYERLSGSYATSSEAMAAAQAVVDQRPDAIGCAAKRMEVPHGS